MSKFWEYIKEHKSIVFYAIGAIATIITYFTSDSIDVMIQSCLKVFGIDITPFWD